MIEVEADMSHPGMGPVFGKAEETTPGNYRAHIVFNMAGDWVVVLRIKLPEGRKIERQTDVRGVQSN
jgi:YtkA-like